MEVNNLERVFDQTPTHRKPHRQSSASKLWDKKTRFVKNKAEKLLKTKAKATRIARNKPENKAEKLLKIRSCGKNKPEQS